MTSSGCFTRLWQQGTPGDEGRRAERGGCRRMDGGAGADAGAVMLEMLEGGQHDGVW